MGKLKQKEDAGKLKIKKSINNYKMKKEIRGHLLFKELTLETIKNCQRNEVYKKIIIIIL